MQEPLVEKSSVPLLLTIPTNYLLFILFSYTPVYMTGLFFAVDPVWWIWSIHLSSLAMALSTGIFVWLWLWYRDRPRQLIPIQWTSPYQYHPTDPSWANYAELTLIEIRRYLTYTHQPEHSWAHIPGRIASYSQEPRLMEIIEQLERAEYSRQDLTVDEKEQISRELTVKLKTVNHP